MPLPLTGKVYVVALQPPAQASLVSTPAERITAALSPGSTTTRYGRDWIVGKTELVDDVLLGRIGFQGAEGVAEVYDRELRDFKAVAVPAGLTAPFAVNLSSLRLAVQPRGAIKLNGLLGAFKALLENEDGTWRVYVPGHETTYARWRRSVSRVIEVRLRLRKPNPHYRDTPDLEALLEQAEAEAANVELRAEWGLDTNAPFVAQSMRHIEAGYGEAIMVGIKEDPAGLRESVYQSSIGSEESPLEFPAGPQGEVERANLIQALSSDERTPPGQEQEA